MSKEVSICCEGALILQNTGALYLWSAEWHGSLLWGSELFGCLVLPNMHFLVSLVASSDELAGWMWSFSWPSICVFTATEDEINATVALKCPASKQITAV